MELKIIEFGSAQYHRMVDLRQEVLRRPVGYPISDDELRRECDDTFLSMIDKEEVIGGCILTELSDKKMKLRQMFVSPLCQGQGLGRKILIFAEVVAQTRGYEELWLHARKTAMNFYHKQGYEIHGDEFLEVGISHYEMYKHL